MLNKLKYSFYRFMNGRYGIDQLGFALLILTLVFSILGGIFIGRNVWVSLLIYALNLLIIYRVFSKKIRIRQQENMKFMHFIKPIQKRLKLIKLNLTQKQYKHYQCPQCHKTLRVPRGRGHIEIQCPRCHTAFNRRS